MTELVDTDELRNLVRLLLDGPPANTPAEMWAIIHQVRRPFFAAADEVDRLRAALVEARAACDRYSQELLERREQSMLNEGRLRAVIENAPHGTGCTGITVAFDDYGTPRRSFSGACTCWKADAL